MKLTFHLSVITLILCSSVYGTITPKQDKFVDNLAKIYSNLMLSFDPEEIPFDDYYDTHSNEVDTFTKIILSTRTELMSSKLLSNLNELERDTLFLQKATSYNLKKMQADTKPNTFEVVKMWYEHQKSSNLQEFCKAHDKSKQIDKHSIVESLSKFNNKHAFNVNRYKFFIELDNTQRKKYLKTKQNEPELSIHHIIPLNTLKLFFKNYFQIQNKREQELMIDHTYNWYKILDHNQRKVLLNTVNHQYTDYHEYLKELASDTFKESKPNYQLQEDTGYSDFMDMMLSLPPGLSFRGPKIRSDDPKIKFESNCALILGEDYFNKVNTLHKEIVNFNDKYNPKNPLLHELDAIRIYNRILTIHLEEGAQIIFDYNPIHWIQEANGKWRLKTSQEWQQWLDIYLPNGEWAVKNLAQEEHDRRTVLVDVLDASQNRTFLLEGVVMPKEFVYYNPFNRRRRGVTTTDLEALKNKCNKVTEVPQAPIQRHFCYSKPYLMLLPPVYVYCRLYYYR